MVLLGDFKTSVKKALDEIDSKWESYNGLIICGSHNPKDPERIIGFIKRYRQSELPILGICYGYQLIYIEFARNVMGFKDATSEEWGENGTFIVRKLKKLNVGVKDGESYWNNYVVEPGFLYKLPKNIIALPYHPEYQSSKEKPHPDLVKFLDLCTI